MTNDICRDCGSRVGVVRRRRDGRYALCWDCAEKRREKQRKEYEARRRALLDVSEYGWDKVRLKILERDRYTCQICGRKEDRITRIGVDHILPVARGGKSTPDNLQVLCDECNSRKGAR